MVNEKRFIGLAGLGSWGKNLLRNLAELGLLHSACDSTPETLKAYRGKYPDVHFTGSFDEILAIPQVKAVALATPASTHYELIRKALLAGKDVYVEKPLALKVSDGEQLVAMAEGLGRVLMVGHILQYHPAVLKLREMIREGVLGKVQYVYSNRLNIGKFRTEENILWSFAPHDISVILMLLDEEPISVNSFGGSYLSDGVYDTTLTALEFAGGVRGHIFVSWLHPFKEQKLIVVGSKSMAVFDDVSQEKLLLYPHAVEWVNGKVPLARKADYEVVALEMKEPLKEELVHFAECVLKRTVPRTDGAEGLAVLKVLDAAERSMLTRKAPARARDYFVHQSAIVDDGVSIGAGTKVWHFSHILEGSRVGSDCIIGQNVMIGPGVNVGNRCKIQNNVSIYKGVEIEDGVFCGPSCVFTNVYNPRAFVERKHEFFRTLVKTGATIGANATIVCGNTIGRYALIGAGAVVTTDVDDYAIMAGVPARRIGWACRCGQPLRFDAAAEAACSRCSSRYKTEGDKFIVVEEREL